MYYIIEYIVVFETERLLSYFFSEAVVKYLSVELRRFMACNLEPCFSVPGFAVAARTVLYRPTFLGVLFSFSINTGIVGQNKLKIYFFTFITIQHSYLRCHYLL